MKRNIVAKSAVPPGPYATALVCIPIEAVPYTLGALVLKSQRYWYVSPDDWHRGRKLLAALGRSLLMDCTGTIVNAIDRVYTLLDSGLNGTVRTVSGTGTELDPYVYNPPLPQTVIPSDFDAPGLRYDADTTRQLLHNLVDGSPTDHTIETRNIRQQLEDIRAILEANGNDGEDIEAVLNLILLALG